MAAVHDPLWSEFIAALRKRSVDLSDIADCSPATFQALLGELGFTAIQSAKLQTLWAKQQHGNGARGPVAAPGRYAAAARATDDAGGDPQRPRRDRLDERSAEFTDVSNQALDFLAGAMAARGLTASVTSIEAVRNPVRERQCKEFRNRLCDPSGGNGGSVVKGRLVPADLVDRTCAQGPVPHGAVDRALPSGLVFHSEADDGGAASLLLGPDAVPTKLVLFDVALGNAKLLTEDDAAALSVYSGDELLRSLRQEGFDSIQVQHAHAYRPDCFVVFDGRHAFPIYVVSYALSSTPSPSRSAAGSRTGGYPASANNKVAAVGSSAVGNQMTATAENRVARASSDAAASSTCAKHHGKANEFWCLDERRLVCSHCMFVDGYQHKRCVLVDDGAAGEVPWLEAWAAKAEAFSGDVARVMSSFEAAMDSIEDAADRTVTRLVARANEVKRQVDDIVASETDRVRALATQQTSALQKALAEVVGTQSAVDDLARAARRSIAAGDSFQILALREAAGRDWPEVAVPEHSLYSLEPLPDPADDAITAALEPLFVTAPRPGDVELPEVIDVNQLAAATSGDVARQVDAVLS